MSRSRYILLLVVMFIVVALAGFGLGTAFTLLKQSF